MTKTLLTGQDQKDRLSVVYVQGLGSAGRVRHVRAGARPGQCRSADRTREPGVGPRERPATWFRGGRPWATSGAVVGGTGWLGLGR